MLGGAGLVPLATRLNGESTVAPEAGMEHGLIPPARERCEDRRTGY
jgi:hypothetical protein